MLVAKTDEPQGVHSMLVAKTDEVIWKHFLLMLKQEEDREFEANGLQDRF